ncbi:MAG: hypothetical protein M1608_10515 [Candidatus Omnitrophica bacterium]|nr:hypothetical protein [Candidatus Omnitrophota bacterium]
MSFSFKQLWMRIPPSWYRHLLGRAVLFLFFAGALGLQWWSWTVRYPAIARIKNQVQSTYRLDNEVQELQLKWSDSEAAQLRFRTAWRDQFLFSNESDLTGWLDAAVQRAKVLNLGLSPQWQPAQPNPKFPGALQWTPITLEIHPFTENRADAAICSRLLAFLEGLATNQLKRVEQVELSVTGNGRAIQQARVVLRLWSLAATNLAATNLLDASPGMLTDRRETPMTSPRK